MLELVKKHLRITANAFDDEINSLINAAKADLKLAGVTATKANDTSDALIVRAVAVYCKANFGYDNPDADRLLNSYNLLKLHLTLSAEYNTESEA